MTPQAESNQSHVGSRWWSPRLRLSAALLLVALALAGLDVSSKGWAFARVSHEGRAISVIQGFFYITQVTNTGAMWSLLPGVRREVWIIVRGGVFLILLILALRSRPASFWARAGFALVLAGALGNLYDNVFYVDIMQQKGAVRDWLRFDFWGWTFPIFNLADSYICVGAPLLLLHFYGKEAKQVEAAM